MSNTQEIQVIKQDLERIWKYLSDMNNDLNDQLSELRAEITTFPNWKERR